MTDRVLFVDDDRALLNTLERNLGFSFPVSIAESGKKALEMIHDGEGFAVVMVDMRMPEMDGIELIKQARKIAPNTVYLMLTGNQDLASATRAVNDGHVYRFLNKPCEMNELKAAIESARHHYDMLMSEKELLQNTFVGAIGVLTETIDSMQTDVVDSASISATVDTLAKAIDLDESWERQLAAKLSLVGLAMMPETKSQVLRRAPTHSSEHLDVFREMTDVAVRMIERIPRLEGVAEILRLQTEGDGRLKIGDQSRQVAATLLRVAFYWDLLRKNGLPPRTAVSEIQFVLPELPNRVTAALQALDQEPVGQTKVDVSPQDLEEGMVLVEDVIAESGALMVSRGRRLTRPIVEKLQQFAASATMPVVFPVAAVSCANEEPVTA